MYLSNKVKGKGEKMKKIVFFDIDGTLLDHGKNEVPESAKKALRLAKERGHDIFIATGRAPFMFETLRSELGIHNYIAMNGQYIVYEGEVLYANPMDKKRIHECVLKAKKEGMHYGSIGLNEARISTQNHAEIIKAFADVRIPTPEYDAEYHVHNDVYQHWIFGSEEQVVSFAQEGIEDLKFVQWNVYALDVLPLGVSKATGITKILDVLQCNISDTVVFGDGHNDIEMFEMAEISVAMGNAVQELKDKATYITTNVDDDGIYTAMKKLKLIE